GGCIDGKPVRERWLDGLALAHFPVRSIDQFTLRTILYRLAWASRADYNPRWGWHYKTFFKQLAIKTVISIFARNYRPAQARQFSESERLRATFAEEKNQLQAVLERALAQVEQMHGSTSWRLTEPLRAASRGFGALRSLGRRQ